MGGDLLEAQAPAVEAERAVEVGDADPEVGEACGHAAPASPEAPPPPAAVAGGRLAADELAGRRDGASSRIGPGHQDRVDVEHAGLLVHLCIDIGLVEVERELADAVTEHLVPADGHEGRWPPVELLRHGRHQGRRRIDAVEVGRGRDVPGQDVHARVVAHGGEVELQVHLGREEDDRGDRQRTGHDVGRHQRRGQSAAARVTGDDELLGGDAARQEAVQGRRGVLEVGRERELGGESQVGHEDVAPCPAASHAANRVYMRGDVPT